jgi:uncharacterized protein DUF4118
MAEPRTERMIAVALGGLLPLVIAMALVPLRDNIDSANVALILVAAVVIAAVFGGREAGAAGALVSAISFDFFYTRPYGQLRIASKNDVETTLLLLLVGLVVGHISTRGRGARRSAEAREGEIKRIHRVANLAARGEEAADVIMATQAELMSLLDLEDCRFEAPPFSSALPRLDRSGALTGHEFHLHPNGFALPTIGAELPVLGRGQLLGRFVLDPKPNVGVSLEQRVVAVALADQVGAVLAAPERSGTDAPGRSSKPHHHGRENSHG